MWENVFNDKLHSCQYARNRWDWQIYQDVHTRRQNKSKHVQQIESSKCYTKTNSINDFIIHAHLFSL